MRDHIEFFKQFRQRFHTTGAVAPSSRYLARAITGPLRKRTGPVQILEVGPGTGAVTKTLVRALAEGDRFDLVELNEHFADMLKQRFATDPEFSRVAAQSEIHVCPLEEFPVKREYDYIISGLPLNNFPAELVRTIFAACFERLKPGGVLSYFEYMFVRPLRKIVAGSEERARLAALDAIMGDYRSRYQIGTDWVFANFPPAWVRHLQKTATAPAPTAAVAAPR